ncbi:bifunctional diguanylate cyclase/phosphodiesterase [Actinoplanes sp. TFC3]|uniref:putative bifunctional diguanylate cyclase/phosphodiesterase n=1 Tax=Actinoplanes sp. TFC3 TaxID=1710355 RepID=UPI001F26DCC3|nr:EAL domain-containing protein [Actinoplanes sp. TFC3]
MTGTALRVGARTPLTLVLAVTGAVVVTLVGALAIPAGSGQRLYNDAAQLAAGALAAFVCLTAAREHRGLRSRWRTLLGFGLTGWTLARLWWVARDVLDPGRATGVGPADFGFLILPVCVFLALLAMSAALPRPVRASLPRDRVVLVIDSVLITGSLVALAWSALPHRVFREVGESPWAAGVAAAYPVADLVLIVMALLVLASRPTWRPARATLMLAVAGLVALGCSDTVRLLTLSTGTLTPLQATGYLLGPALLAVAALTNPGTAAPPAVDKLEADWLHLILPYVPVVATGIVIAVRTGAGGQLTSYEAYLGWLGLGLVVARQMFTIVDNTVLLARVSEGQERLHHQAYHDPLTGLANRALFRERLALALDSYRYQGLPVALIFADLDDFKLINDSFGHAIGDRLLRAIADRLRTCVGPADLVARLGGDEFAVLLEHRAGEADPIAEAMLAALRAPFELDGHTVAISASLGLVRPHLGERDLSADILLRRADAAMYASKRRGKNALVRYAGSADGGPNADLPHLLMRALAGSPADYGFEVHYQPIVHLADETVLAVEALARWNDPIAGPVDPEVFVTVAERAGLVAAIDDFVLDRACSDAAALAATYGRPIDVHVNVSAARLGQHGLAQGVLAALHRHDVPASRLVVEITETKRIPDLSRAVEVTETLRRHGVRVALDDFGSGYNALAQLHSLPIDIVKLDSSLTDVDVAPERAGALCRSVLTICADMGVAVIAEGIETRERAVDLAGLGCKLGQGYLFGQPRAVHRLVEVVPAQPGPDRGGAATSGRAPSPSGGGPAPSDAAAVPAGGGSAGSSSRSPAGTSARWRPPQGP